MPAGAQPAGGSPPSGPLGPSPGPSPATGPGAAQPPSVTPPSPAAPSAAPPYVPPAPPTPSQTQIPSPFTLGQTGSVPTAVFEFHPTFFLSAQYTDNFQLTQTSRVSNVRTTAGPGFNLIVNAPRTQGTVSTSLNVAHDSATEGFNHAFFPSFSANLRHTFGPELSVTLTDSFTRNDDGAQADPFGLRRERALFAANSFGVSVDWLVGAFATQAYYRNSLFFSDENTFANIFGLNASTRLGALNTLRVGYELSFSQSSGTDTSGITGRPPGSTDDSVGQLFLASLSRQLGAFASGGVSTTYSMQSRDDSSVWNISLFLGYGLPSGLSISGSLGYSLLSSANQDTTSAVSTSTSIGYRFGLLAVSLGVSQDFRQTYLTGQDFGIVLTRSVSASASYPWTPFMSSSIFASYSENEFTGTGNVQQGQKFNRFAAGATFGWQILRWLSMSLSYSYTDTSGDATIQGAGTSENRATLSFSAAF